MRLKFNEDENNYDLLRPRYCNQLFGDIIEYVNLNSNSDLLEVGIGTGQATEPFLKLGCSVTAIELGNKLAAFSKQKFKTFDKFQIHNVAFEDYNYDSNVLDMIY